MTCDGRLFHRRAAATGNALSPSGQTSTSNVRDVDEAERSRQASVSAGRRSSSQRHVGVSRTMLTFL